MASIEPQANIWGCLRMGLWWGGCEAIQGKTRNSNLMKPVLKPAWISPEINQDLPIADLKKWNNSVIYYDAEHIVLCSAFISRILIVVWKRQTTSGQSITCRRQYIISALKNEHNGRKTQDLPLQLRLEVSPLPLLAFHIGCSQMLQRKEWEVTGLILFLLKVMEIAQLNKIRQERSWLQNYS